MVNIFVGLSQHHIDIFENFLISKKIVGGEHILLTGNGMKLTTSYWDEVILFNSNLNNQSQSKVERFKNIQFKISEYKKVVESLKKYREKPNLNLIYSSLEDVLSNYLFFYFSKNLKGIIIEDGILNYYLHTRTNVPYSVLSLKKVLALLKGLNFKFYNGHTSGIDYKRANIQYVREPVYSLSPKKSKKFPVSRKQIDSLDNNILVLGQEPYANVNNEEYNTKLRRLLDNIKLSKEYKKAKKILYKPHRHGPRKKASFFINQFEDKKVEYLDIQESAEEYYFKTARCKTVVTFDSSAVFNIYIQCDEQTRKKININVMPFYVNELTILFKKLEFNFY